MRMGLTSGFGQQAVQAAVIVLIVGGATTSTACTESCDITSGLGEPYKAAIQSPETFDTWVAQHPNYFTDERVSCLEEKERQAYQREIDLLNQCDQHFAGDAEGLDFCRSSIENPEDFTTFWVAVLFAARGQGSFLQTGVGQQLWSFKQDDQAFYNSMTSEMFMKLGPAIEEAFQCKHCSKSLFGIF